MEMKTQDGVSYMIDTSKYDGHTEGPWSIYSPVTQVTKKYRDDNEGKLGLPMSDWSSYGVAGVGPCTMRRYMNDPEPIKTWHANIHLVADAPDLLAEVKRLRSIADYLFACIVGDAYISLGLIGKVMDWREEE